jgi:hypothetical protein
MKKTNKLNGERVNYDKKIVVTLSQQLQLKYGNSEIDGDEE